MKYLFTFTIALYAVGSVYGKLIHQIIIRTIRLSNTCRQRDEVFEKTWDACSNFSESRNMNITDTFFPDADWCAIDSCQKLPPLVANLTSCKLFQTDIFPGTCEASCVAFAAKEKKLYQDCVKANQQKDNSSCSACDAIINNTGEFLNACGPIDIGAYLRENVSISLEKVNLMKQAGSFCPVLPPYTDPKWKDLDTVPHPSSNATLYIFVAMGSSVAIAITCFVVQTIMSRRAMKKKQHKKDLPGSKSPVPAKDSKSLVPDSNKKPQQHDNRKKQPKKKDEGKANDTVVV